MRVFCVPVLEAEYVKGRNVLWLPLPRVKYTAVANSLCQASGEVGRPSPCTFMTAIPYLKYSTRLK